MDSFSNQSFCLGRVLECVKCGYPNQIDFFHPTSTLNHSMQEFNLLEDSIKPRANQGDCEEPASSSEEEPQHGKIPEPVQPERLLKSFRTNLSNNRWLKDKCKELLRPMKNPPPMFSRSLVHRKPLKRASKSQAPVETPVETPTRVVKIDLYRNVSKSKANRRALSSVEDKNAYIKTVNLVEQLKNPKNCESARSSDIMPPEPKPYKLY